MKKYGVWLSAFLLLAGCLFAFFFHMQEDNFSFVWLPKEERGDRSVVNDLRYSFLLHMGQEAWKIEGNSEHAAVKAVRQSEEKKEIMFNYQYRLEPADILSVEKSEEMGSPRYLAKLSRLHLDAEIFYWKDDDNREEIVKKDVCIWESSSSQEPILAAVEREEDGTYAVLYPVYTDGDMARMLSKDFPAVSQNRKIISCAEKSYLLLGGLQQEAVSESSKIVKKDDGIYQIDQKGTLSAFYEGKQGEYILSLDADEEGVCILLWKDGGARLALFDTQGDLLQERSIDLQKENIVYGLRLSGAHLLLGVTGGAQDQVQVYHRETLTEEKHISIGKGYGAVVLQEIMDGKQEICYHEGRLYLAEGRANASNVRWYLMVYDENGEVYRGVLHSELIRPYRYPRDMESIVDLQDAQLMRMMDRRINIFFSENELYFAQ